MKPSDFKETDKQTGGMPPCVSTYDEDIPQWALNLIIGLLAISSFVMSFGSCVQSHKLQTQVEAIEKDAEFQQAVEKAVNERIQARTSQ